MKTYFRITAYSREHDISFIVDSVNQHERIQDVIREIIQNFSLIEGTDETQFDDGNIPRAKPNGDCFILRACMKGRVKKQDGVININGRFYRPQKGR